MSNTTFFFILIPVLAIVLIAVNLLFATHSPYQEKNSAFECGFHSFLGQNRMQFNISFYIFGLLFLLFDLEILLMYPYPVSSYFNSLYGLFIMLIFFLVLTLGFAFELGKNALKIDSRQYDTKNITFKPKNILESRILPIFNKDIFIILGSKIWPLLKKFSIILLATFIVLMGIVGFPKIFVNTFFYNVFILSILAGISSIFVRIIYNIIQEDFNKNTIKNIFIYFLCGFTISMISLCLIIPYVIKPILVYISSEYLYKILYSIEYLFIMISSFFSIFSNLDTYHTIGENTNNKLEKEITKISTQLFMERPNNGADNGFYVENYHTGPNRNSKSGPNRNPNSGSDKAPEKPKSIYPEVHYYKIDKTRNTPQRIIPVHRFTINMNAKFYDHRFNPSNSSNIGTSNRIDDQSVASTPYTDDQSVASTSSTDTQDKPYNGYAEAQKIVNAYTGNAQAIADAYYKENQNLMYAFSRGYEYAATYLGAMEEIDRKEAMAANPAAFQKEVKSTDKFAKYRASLDKMQAEHDYNQKMEARQERIDFLEATKYCYLEAGAPKNTNNQNMVARPGSTQNMMARPGSTQNMIARQGSTQNMVARQISTQNMEARFRNNQNTGNNRFRGS